MSFAPSETRSEKNKIKGRLAGLLIFVVDDDAVQLHVVRDILEEEGGRVIGATNPELMLETLKENAPDVLIADVVMPEMDGWELFRQMRKTKLNKETPVLFLTALVEEESEKQFTQGTGRCCMLAKPIERQKLVGAVLELRS
ncbi:MAG: response regulator [Verrucomicrobiae bacterium]|nr:response regulator [Verrucomicrobiae bacterium]